VPYRKDVFQGENELINLYSFDSCRLAHKLQ
jgi:hypothetical protein